MVKYVFRHRESNSSRLNYIPVINGTIVLILSTLSFSAVTAGNREQLQGSQAVISCKVTGLTKVLDGVKWTKSDNSKITYSVNSFVVDTGRGSFSGDTQTTTLTVPASQTDVDKTYNCLITSNQHGHTDNSTTVNLKVFCE